MLRGGVRGEDRLLKSWSDSSYKLEQAEYRPSVDFQQMYDSNGSQSQDRLHVIYDCKESAEQGGNRHRCTMVKNNTKRIQLRPSLPAQPLIIIEAEVC